MADEGAARVQEARGLDALFFPKSLVVVGASASQDNVGQRLLRNILAAGFTGRVYAVHPHASEILGVRAYGSVVALPEAVDLAVVAVPAQAVIDIARACGERGVRGLVVISAGFRETGEAGLRREAELRAILLQYGMRLIGPNCLGIQNLDPRINLDATFVTMPRRNGPVALMTQSGAVGIAMVEHAHRVGVGIGRFASIGNKLNVSGNDLLLLWEQDPDVRVLALYLESFGNPVNFLRISRRLGRSKPLLVLKSGRTSLGARAAGSHTGALAEGDEMVDALFEQCGVIRASTMEELFDLAAALSMQPMPRGERVAIVTNSGGPGIMAVDAMAGTPLQLATLGPSTVAACRQLLPAEASLANPIDLLAAGGPLQFRAVLGAVMTDPGVDAVVALYTPVGSAAPEVAAAIADVASENPGKPLVTAWMGRGPGSPGFDALTSRGVPTYMFPESAVRSLAAMARLHEWRKRPEGTIRRFPVAPAATAALQAPAGGWLRGDAALDLVRAYGLATPKYARARSGKEAAMVSTSFQAPLVLKAEAPGLIHKTEAGAVTLDLPHPQAVAAEFEGMRKRVAQAGHNMESALVMEQAAPGRELLLGGLRDERFGPVVAFGIGGVHAELLRDVALRMAPLTDVDARLMMRSIKGFPLLAGTRGQSPVDLDAAAEAILRLSQLLVDHPEVAECDLNPVRAYEKGLLVLDARFRVTSPRGGATGAGSTARPG